MDALPWTHACATDDIDAEDLNRFEHDSLTFTSFRRPEDEYVLTSSRSDRP